MSRSPEGHKRRLSAGWKVTGENGILVAGSLRNPNVSLNFSGLSTDPAPTFDDKFTLLWRGSCGRLYRLSLASLLSAPAASGRFDFYLTPGEYSWSKPSGATLVFCYVIGGGGSGAGGPKGVVTSTGGGSGGGGGGRARAVFTEALIGAALHVYVGAGGLPNTSQKANGSLAGGGIAGVQTQIGISTGGTTICFAGGGGAGDAAASGANSVGVSGGSGGMLASGSWTGGSGTGNNGSTGSTGGDSTSGGGGGGSAAGSTVGPFAGGSGGLNTTNSNTTRAPGGAGSSSGDAVDGDPGADFAGGLEGGNGGGGGGSCTFTNGSGGDGGAGGWPGGAGGGGGATVNGTGRGGVGGAGADGAALILTFF